MTYRNAYDRRIDRITATITSLAWASSDRIQLNDEDKPKLLYSWAWYMINESGLFIT